MDIKRIPGHSNYGVTRDGRVFSWAPKNGWGKLRKTPIELKPQKHSNGYLQVSLGKNNVRLIHRLVLTTFIGPPADGLECRHLNGDKQDNRLENLEWGTRRENFDDAMKHRSYVRGESHPNSTLTKRVVLAIRKRHIDGLTYTEIGEEFGVHPSTVGKIVRRERWSHI